MHQLIRFRTLLDTFSNFEFDAFINKLYNTFDKRSIIISSLFHLLLNEFKKNETNYITNVNKIILDIISFDFNNNANKLSMQPNIFNELSILSLLFILFFNLCC